MLVVQLSTGARRVALSGHNTLTVLPSPVVVVLNPSVRTLAASALAQFSVTCRARTPSGRRVPGAVSLRLDSRLLSPDAGVFRFSSLGAGGVLAGPHRLTARFRGSEDYRPATASDSFVVTPTPIATARTPTFASVIPAATGFTVQITNYDPQWSWSGDATASGVVGISVTGLVTVSGVTPDTSSILTVTTTRAGYPSASATARGTSLAQALRASLTSITGLNGSVIDDTLNGSGFIDQSYAAADRWLLGYVNASTSVTLNWHVTGANGASLVGAPVTLLDNLSGSGSTGTQWSEVGLNASSNGELTAVTDADGDVSFTVENTNSSAGSPPSDLTTGPGAQANEAVYPWTRTALRVGDDVISADPNSTVQQVTDLVDLIVIPVSTGGTNFDVTHGSLLWSEDFSGAAGAPPASSVFTPEVGQYTGTAPGLANWNYGTGEIEDNTASPTNLGTDGNGNLAITSLCTVNCTTSGNWTSARISTAGKVDFQYGQIEARIKLPAGSFNWPAFWMLGQNFFPSQSWPNCGEIDIAEGLQGDSVDQATLHANYPGTSSDWGGGSGVTLTAPLSSISAGFHTYGILWTPTSISFILDGHEWGSDVYDAAAGTVTQTNGDSVSTFKIGGQVWPFDQPFFLIFDDAIPAGTVAANGTTSTMDVSWIKYYSYEGYGQVSS